MKNLIIIFVLILYLIGLIEQQQQQEFTEDSDDESESTAGNFTLASYLPAGSSLNALSASEPTVSRDFKNDFENVSTSRKNFPAAMENATTGGSMLNSLEVFGGNSKNNGSGENSAYQPMNSSE